jgi:hypothetical protein
VGICVDGGIRSSNLTNLIQKSNIFQNDAQNNDMQRQTLLQLEIKLGKKEDEDEQEVK